MTSTIVYTGDLRTELTHLQSGTIIETDAPTDNMGKGERFSPTDLLATSYGACMITTMAIKAAAMNLNFNGTKIDITKIMSTDAPRRVIEIKVALHFTENFIATTEQKEQLVRIARACPVEKSLHPDIKLDVTFNW
ncbi:MAG: OsmC family protein [Bacteroidetes bacterium]|nr:OsmC family protein [Bacteroidota bacterium]MBS1650073.1 OsmC family protein [Bacteroidota bacterium]